MMMAVRTTPTSNKAVDNPRTQFHATRVVTSANDKVNTFMGVPID